MKVQYKLAPYLDEAYKAQVPNGFQKEFKEADQRVNLLYNTIEGKSLKIFPVPMMITINGFHQQNIEEAIMRK